MNQQKWLIEISPKSKFSVFNFKRIPQPGPRRRIPHRPPPHEFSSYFSWTIVRNPYDRLVSAYQSKIINKRGGGLVEYRHLKSFKEFVRVIENENLNICDRHIRCQNTLFPTDIERIFSVSRTITSQYSSRQ